MQIKTTLIIAAAMAAIAIPAVAQHKHPPMSVSSSANMEKIKPKKGLNSQDRKFIMGAAIANMAEVALGQLAQQKGGAWSKAFGADMVREHGMAESELESVAKARSVKLPKDIDAKHKALAAKLSKLSGSGFDAAYRAAMVKGHTAVLMAVQTEIKNGSDSSVRNYAVKMEPAVKMHLKMAQTKTTMTHH